MPIKTVTYVICDRCENPIPEGDNYWDYSTHGMVFCCHCMEVMSALDFSRLVFDGDHPHDFQYVVENGKSVRGWKGF